MMGDIIVSTTDAGVSTGIRIGTSSAVSHAAMYDGAGMLIEAVGHGVVATPIGTALADDTLAVAYRRTEMNDEERRKVVEWALKQIGVPYSVLGAVLSVDKLACSVTGPQKGTFFCSQLVLEAYRQAGIPLTSLPSQCVTPQDTVVIVQTTLAYVGHLKGSLVRFPVIGR
jgi:uncharacterized protein YycO